MPASIQEIPVETLSHIFRCILSIESSPTFPLDLRLVCTRWRVVAEQTSELWPALVTGHGMEWTRRAIKFSKAAPLDITLPYAPDTARDRQELELLVLEQLYRIRTLNFTTHKITSDNLKLLVKPAPLLERVTMYNNAFHYPPSLNLGDDLFSVPPPRLTHLALTEAHLSPNFSALMSPLTHLHLKSCIIWLSIDDVLTTLSGLPQLQSFIWKPEFYATSMKPPVQREGQRIQMDHLVHLEMEDTFIIISTIMTHIALPPTCSIALDADVDGFAVEDLPDALDSAFLLHFATVFAPTPDRRYSVPGFTHLEILDHDEDDYGFAAVWSKPRCHRPAPATFKFSLFGEDQITEALPQILSHVLEQWPGTATSISHLTLFHSELCDEAQTWRTLFDHLEYLSYLETGGAAAETLYEALHEAEEMQLDCLHKITLRDMDLSIFEYTGYIREMEDRRKDHYNPPESRCPRKISFVNCTLMGEKLSRMDITLREAAGGEEKTYGKDIYGHDD
ncbi:hypothetical protein PENSPDRAFT_751738 [Peniophora sp. CONT]|nr:hypothetical protein PENSPDRAFT_751738 [Peniophora sp. CONT]